MKHLELLGFVPVDEIINTFRTEYAKIDDYLAINGMFTNEKDIFEFVDNIRLALICKAENNIKEYLAKNPDVLKEERVEKEKTEIRKTRISWEDRVKETRNQIKR